MILKIDDFGEKIGGAKKDIWKKRGLRFDDILEMNEREKQVYIKKDNIWAKPNYEELVKAGMSIQIAYFIKTLRDSLPQNLSVSTNNDEKYKAYIKFVENIRDHAMLINSKKDAEDFYKNHVLYKYVTPSYGRFVDVISPYQGMVTNKFLRAVSSVNWYKIDSEIQKKQFCFTEEQKLLNNYHILYFENTANMFDKDYNGNIILSVKYKNGKTFYYPEDQFAKKENWKSNSFFLTYERKIVANNFNTIEEAREVALTLAKENQKNLQNKKKKGKRKFVPLQLKHVIRKGVDYRNGRNIKGQDYLEKFQFRGGEFGNWLNEKDRQYSLNYGYDAFMDLGKALNIDPKDVSLGNNLAIAFGARGSGNALAHYEPLSTVINLTKMKGAGSLAHEWGHALDDYIGRKLGISTCDSFASHFYMFDLIEKKLPSLNRLMMKIKYKDAFNNTYEKTDFYKNSIRFDGYCSKTDHGYWQSDVEMFARCFACYVHDKLGFRSDYLTGHANSAVMSIQTDSGEQIKIKAFPEGKERVEINQCFDELIKDLKEKEYLHDYDYQKEVSREMEIDAGNNTTIELQIDKDGQFCLFDLEEEKEL